MGHTGAETARPVMTGLTRSCGLRRQTDLNLILLTKKEIRPPPATPPPPGGERWSRVQLEFMRPCERLELRISGQKEHKGFIQAGEAWKDLEAVRLPAENRIYTAAVERLPSAE